MGNFISEKVRGVKDILKDTLDKRFIFIIIHLAAFALGIIIGITTEPTVFIFNYYSDNAKNYYRIVMYAESSCFNILLERIISNLGYFLVFAALGILPALLPLCALITAYRGFILTLTIKIFAAQFGLTGILLCCFLILPQNLITTIALIVCSVTFPSIKKRCDGKKAFVNYLLLCAAAYAVSIAGAIIETLILCLLLRPMNFYF